MKKQSGSGKSPVETLITVDNLPRRFQQKSNQIKSHKVFKSKSTASGTSSSFGRKAF